MVKPRTALAAVLVLILMFAGIVTAAPALPDALSDEEFRQFIGDFSEAGGSFRFEYMSNERQYQSVIPELRKSSAPNGVYLGVGPEQNFTYIAAVQPRMAFIFDIRRQNLLEHLMYKAIFEMSANRKEFLSLLFSRLPVGEIADNAAVQDLFEGFRTARADTDLFSTNFSAIADRLSKVHGFTLNRQDREDMADIYEALFDGGPGVNTPVRAQTGNTTYRDLMLATDGTGTAQSYLASDEKFQIVRRLHEKNLIVPVVGDFAGPSAIQAVGTYLKDRDAVVSSFYTSNVEQYLFQQGDDWKHFLSSVATLPVNSSSVFIRSAHYYFDPATGARSQTLSGANFLSLLGSISDSVAAYGATRIQSYDDIIRLSHPAGQ